MAKLHAEAMVAQPVGGGRWCPCGFDVSTPSWQGQAVAAGATMRTLHVALSDVDRGVYETLELRVAQHPSESLRYLWSRILGYCLSYEEGIQFSKGGLSSAEEPPLAIRGPDGTFEAWIDIGTPSAARLHKASKTARRVVVYSSASVLALRKEAARRAVYRVEDIEIWLLPPSLLDALAEHTERTMSLELVRTENHMYATLNGAAFEGRVALSRLVGEP